MELKGDVFSMDGKTPKSRILIVIFFDCIQEKASKGICSFDGFLP
jgi:hypothetical protein